MSFVWFALWMIVGLITGLIARSKGRNFFAWFFFGLLLAILAIPWALLLKPNRVVLDQRAVKAGESKTCEHCAELIRRDAKACRFCGRDVAFVATPAPAVMGEGQY